MFDSYSVIIKKLSEATSGDKLLNFLYGSVVGMGLTHFVDQFIMKIPVEYQSKVTLSMAILCGYAYSKLFRSNRQIPREESSIS